MQPQSYFGTVCLLKCCQALITEISRTLCSAVCGMCCIVVMSICHVDIVCRWHFLSVVSYFPHQLSYYSWIYVRRRRSPVLDEAPLVSNGDTQCQTLSPRLIEFRHTENG
ncbi:hypothetical protein EDB81DRAFT_802467 [Dactylonectria macrodidyma]|uniref:Uncharacterized protein n=1 Tax=Dactylonectria macrodidyma TaxID=307937 RepID=A0A9P9J001_9HYPO|nr:hypothetical protein EDB81DRAFT_802467 [Dactylonectria macrodidyma]